MLKYGISFVVTIKVLTFASITKKLKTELIIMAKHSLWMTALLWVGITTAVQAQQRDLHELDSIANSVFTTNTGARAIGSPLKMSLKSSEVLQADSLATREAFYIYTPTNKSEEKFVIVSGDQRMPAILGYSDESNFDLTNIPDGLKWFLKKCEADAYLASQDFTETRATDAVEESRRTPVRQTGMGTRRTFQPTMTHNGWQTCQNGMCSHCFGPNNGLSPLPCNVRLGQYA